jgi:hypothetical protein
MATEEEILDSLSDRLENGISKKQVDGIAVEYSSPEIILEAVRKKQVMETLSRRGPMRRVGFSSRPI